MDDEALARAVREALLQRSLFLGEMIGMSHEQALVYIKDAFEIKDDALDNTRVIIGADLSDGYEGNGFFLVLKAGKLWVVTGGHCSCNGYEGQWSPTEVTREYLMSPLFSTELYDDDADNKIKALLRDMFGAEEE